VVHRRLEVGAVEVVVEGLMAVEAPDAQPLAALAVLVMNGTGSERACCRARARSSPTIAIVRGTSMPAAARAVY
jgi:hypothetical protein